MPKNREIINELTSCLTYCENCYTACFEEPDIKHLTRCIKLVRDCAEVCSLTLGFVARNSSEAVAMVRTCAELCATCAEECNKHDHVHCKECADACSSCEESCLKYLNQTETATA